MIIKTNLANKANYGASRSTSKIKFIVIHYTGNDGDTDEGNGKYFKNNVVQASAHYFVDSDSITQSVPDNYVAWSVGGKKYASASRTGGAKYYGICTNTNSISIELTDDVKNGTIYPSEKTIQNALELTQSLMKKYSVPKENVIRHFDVTGKLCPAYWVDDAKWQKAFLSRLETGGIITPTTASNAATAQTVASYKVKITADILNVRAGAGTGYKVTTTVKKGYIFTIVQEQNGWGKLKSGAGWINLAYTQKV